MKINKFRIAGLLHLKDSLCYASNGCVVRGWVNTSNLSKSINGEYYACRVDMKFLVSEHLYHLKNCTSIKIFIFKF